MEEIIHNIDKSIENYQDIFQQQNNLNKDNKYVFYEGPPFATGNPHYGHILNGIIKDVVCRWKIMEGYNVSRNAGWDCHGLPIENKMEQKYKIKSSIDIEEFGIDNYNNCCREMVFECVDNWKLMASKIGRWIDFENDYKTMSKEYMECVWNVFKRIYDKGYVYRGFKVMPYSISLSTPLSNFEASSNYKDTNDICATVKFPFKYNILNAELDIFILVWTTTPWTLPSNTCLAVNKEIDYIIYKDIDKNENYLVCLTFYNTKIKDNKKIKTEIIYNLKGDDLVNQYYTPLFNYNTRVKEFKIYQGDFVSDDKGTGIVHISPAFGEDDFNLCVTKKILDDTFSNLFIPVDIQGNFTKEVIDFEGKCIFEVNKDICDVLKNRGLLYERNTIVHSYPYCWRSNTKLMYRAVDSWFIKVSDIKEQLVENNNKVNWIPGYVGKERFNNWLENARDWNFSRKRYWGCPIPIWVNVENPEDKIVIGSVEELHQYTGIMVEDLHRENIDDIIIEYNNHKYKRIVDVMDCWFESGSMPYAKDGKLNSELIPAEFICEGLDQTRGWFYTLLVISTILDNTAPYKNVIVNGLVLAEDGKKMSKNLNNYPDPNLIIEKYGGDALRYYLIFSGASMGNSLCFKDSDVKNVCSNIILALYNTCKFYQDYLNNSINNGFEFDILKCITLESTNISDRWILHETNLLYKNIKEKMDKYELKNIGDMIQKYIDKLNNIYVRLNRDRFRHHSEEATYTLCKVLHDISIILAPFIPFITNYIFEIINRDTNIKNIHLHQHHELLTLCDKIDNDLEMSFDLLVELIDYIRKFRVSNNRNQKIPLSKLIIKIDKSLSIYKDVENIDIIFDYIKKEGNIKEIEVEYIENLYKIKGYNPNFREYKESIGLNCLKQAQKDLCQNGILKDIYMTDNGKEIKLILDKHIKTNVVLVSKLDKKSQIDILSSRILLEFDTTIDYSIKKSYLLNQIYSNIQQYRKVKGYTIKNMLDLNVYLDKEIIVEYSLYDTIQYKNNKITFKYLDNTSDKDIIELDLLNDNNYYMNIR